MRARLICLAALALGTALAWAADPPGDAERRLDRGRLTHEQIAAARFPLREVQLRGLQVFSTPFGKPDGYGDGPMDPAKDTRKPGNRPTLQGNGTFLRANGLDAQTCLECHAIVSNATVPARLGVGGVGGSVTNAIILPASMDIADGDTDGVAAFDGRFANPPFVFGAGGVELLAKEMTADLQERAARARQLPGTDVALVTKGVDFGVVRASAQGVLDTSRVVGVDADLIVRPFGRKGDVPSIRAFDTDALQFHFGMQPAEVVGVGVDADGDGVVDEISEGDLSALSVFVATLERPYQQRLTARAAAGAERFGALGCAECHRPSLESRSRFLTFSSPEVLTDATANVYRIVDLSRGATRFRRNRQGGVTVPLFADLKRHDMGPGLAESFGLATAQRNREFTTARLWGIADTAPYLHDGRAATLAEAILLHGGEAQAARDGFAALTAAQRSELIAFLATLRTPRSPARRLVRLARRRL